MTEIPAWWLALSGAFFFLAIVLVIGTLVLNYKLYQEVKQLRPRVDELIVKVNSVATKVDEVASTVQETVENIGGRARGMAGSAELVATGAGHALEKYTPLIGGLMTAIKIVQFIRGRKKKSGLFGLFG